MFDQSLWSERIKQEKALRKNEKSTTMVQQLNGDAIFGSKKTYSRQPFENNVQSRDNFEFSKENAEPNSKFNAGQFEQDNISCKVGQSTHQQHALKSRCNSLVEQYRQRRDKEQNQSKQASFDMMMGHGIVQRDHISTNTQQINGLFQKRDTTSIEAGATNGNIQQRPLSSTQQNQRLKRQFSTKMMESRNIQKALDFKRVASANRLGPSHLQNIGGLGTIGMITVGNKPITDMTSYKTTSQMIGHGQEFQFGKVNPAQKKYESHIQILMDKGRIRANNEISSDNAFAQNSNGGMRKPPKAPNANKGRLDVQTIKSTQGLAAFRNKSSNLLS